MGLAQSRNTCQTCGDDFPIEKGLNEQPIICRRCTFQDQEHQNRAMKCSLCYRIFAAEGYVDPQFRVNARCNDCANIMRKHMQDLKYKEFKFGDRKYSYPTSVEDDVYQHLTGGETNKKRDEVVPLSQGSDSQTDSTIHSESNNLQKRGNIA